MISEGLVAKGDPMILVITDTGMIWNKDNPFLKKYKDIVLVVCLEGKKVTDEYECFVSPYWPYFVGMDSYGAESFKFKALASVAGKLNSYFGYHDKIVFLSDSDPTTLYPFYATKDLIESNSIHLVTMPPLNFEDKNRVLGFHELLSDLSAVDSILYYDINKKLDEVDKDIELKDFFDDIRDELRFADCVEFYDDWGTGDNIKLDVFYRMCDELVEAISHCPELLETDQSRYDGRLHLKRGELHPDTNKHILAFDLIFCCSVYDLFDGIPFTRRNMKEKQLYLAEKAKAEDLKASFDKAHSEMELLSEAYECFTDMISVGDRVIHKQYGEGIVDSVDEKYLVATYKKGQVEIGLAIGISNGLFRFDATDFDEKVEKYRAVLKKYAEIPRRLDRAAEALVPYEEYIE